MNERHNESKRNKSIYLSLLHTLKRNADDTHGTVQLQLTVLIDKFSKTFTKKKLTDVLHRQSSCICH